MNIVCVAACTAGIAHTYIAREKLIKGAKALGHNIRVETQGTIGTENELLTEDISAADVVILAVDVKIKGEERFSNKRIVRVKTEIVIKSPIQFLEKACKKGRWDIQAVACGRLEADFGQHRGQPQTPGIRSPQSGQRPP